MEPKDYLKLPYHRVFVKDEESGWYTSFIFEFPGCISQGENIQEANEMLEDAAEAWIEAALDLGQTIPEPCENFWRGALKCLGIK